MAFVCVQHLDPDHESMMADLLQNYTPMPVNLAEDGMPLEKNGVYLIPPNAPLTTENGRLWVAHPAPPRGHRTPIDVFLESLAEERGADAVGIILSGTGSDGSLGVRAIREAGGATIER